VKGQKKYLKKILVLGAVSIALSTIFCARFFRRTEIVEPVRIVIVDESRVNNTKVRHIFGEFLLKGIIDNGNDKVEVVDLDSIDNAILHAVLIDYLVIYDIMDFGIWNIEEGTDKVLASVKVVNHYDNIITDSFVAGAKGKSLEVICWETAQELSGPIVKTLIELQKAQEQSHEVLSEPQDSL
jgi:hypothetical protein